jgi:sec-independent protein translocase protein TatA
MSLSIVKLLLILLVVLLLFGAGRLPRVMGDLGKAVRALKEGLKEEDVAETPVTPAPAKRVTDETNHG